MDLENIDSIDDIISEKETLSVPIGICFTETEASEWKALIGRIKIYNKTKHKKLKISDFSRSALRGVARRLDALLKEKGF